MGHRNAPLPPTGRRLLCERIAAGAPIAHVASAMGISRQCASKWWHRYLEFGVDGLGDRSSRPVCSPRRLSEQLEAKICRQRRTERVGPDRLAIHLGLSASTIYRVLRRHDLNRLSYLDRATARPIRRYERSRPKQGRSAAAFWRRALAWFVARSVVIERVLTDNHFTYQTNGKVERFHRTLLDEWAYQRP